MNELITVRRLINLLELFHDDTIVLFKDPNCYNVILGVSDYIPNRDEVKRHTGINLPHNDIVVIWGD